MVCGTTSNAGKSTVVAGLCRVLARRGVRVAPFKAQNMSLNSVVTPSGHEIGRAQASQAAAAGVVPEAAMNPVLLKPMSDHTSNVIVLGEPHSVQSAAEYQDSKQALFDVAADALAGLRRRFDVVLLEGAGSPTEINLIRHDIVNLRLAARAGVPAIVVGDIDLGGVFAALHGTVDLLPGDLRAHVRGFVVNKFRGDASLLSDGFTVLEKRCGVPTLGVLPFLPGIDVDAEDSLALDRIRSVVRTGDSSRTEGGVSSVAEAQWPGDSLDVAVVRFPRISNFTDLDPLAHEPGVAVRFVSDVASLGRPDLVILPGTRSTVDDLEWLRGTGLDRAIGSLRTVVFGICGGYQMMGSIIEDGVESPQTLVSGLGWLPVTTAFRVSKVTTQQNGTAMGHPVSGYQIHHGRVTPHDGSPFVVLKAGVDGSAVDGVSTERCAGTTLHGIFENDGFRADFLAGTAEAAGKRFVASGVPFASIREAQFDRIADAIETHLDMRAIEKLISQASDSGSLSSGASG